MYLVLLVELQRMWPMPLEPLALIVVLVVCCVACGVAEDVGGTVVALFTIAYLPVCKFMGWSHK